MEIPVGRPIVDGTAAPRNRVMQPSTDVHNRFAIP